MNGARGFLFPGGFKTVHELSIAMSIVELAQEEAERRGGFQVSAIHLRLGPLSGVVKDALLSAYELACEGTPLAGSRLQIEDVPIIVYCPRCADRRPLASAHADFGGASGQGVGSQRAGDSGMNTEPRPTSQPRLVEVRQNVLKHNDSVARALRTRLRKARVVAISLVSSPGSGKTTFLEKTLLQLQPGYRVAALVGDLATENDATRLARTRAPVKQITTGTLCHLEAEMVQRAIEDWDLNDLDILFIENVGNLVCPASYDLGEALRLVLLSVAEGEDKPLKYPSVFNTADVAVITKMDLAEAVEFDWPAVSRNIQSVRPGMRVLQVSAKTGDGMDEWLLFLSGFARSQQSP